MGLSTLAICFVETALYFAKNNEIKRLENVGSVRRNCEIASRFTGNPDAEVRAFFCNMDTGLVHIPDIGIFNPIFSSKLGKTSEELFDLVLGDICALTLEGGGSFYPENWMSTS
jgi:hypothetical protein